MIPKNEPVKIRTDNKVIWIYGVPYSGKTVMASTFPSPLMINTDGNTKFIDTPRILLRDKVTKSGRLINKTLAWEIFKELIDELEDTENNTYNTLVLDLVEDTYQMCRQYIFDKYKINHESDDSFKYWDIVTQEFMKVMGRFLTLEYDNIILISHEDKSRDIIKGSGDNVTEVKPNLRDKVAIKLSGMVDLVGRVVIGKDDARSLELQVSNIVSAGKRLPIDVNSVELSYKALDELYQKALNTKKGDR